MGVRDHIRGGEEHRFPATGMRTTVGYGDIVPDQTAGKIIAAFLMLGGLSLISVVTAVITSGLLSRAEAHRRGGAVKERGTK